MSDGVLRGLWSGPELLVVSVSVTEVCREARARHGLAPTSSQLLAEGLVAGAILSALQKSERTRINLQIECDGPARGMLVDADVFGRLRGFVRSKGVHFPLSDRFDARQALGTTGSVSVLRDVEGVFYRGTVGLEHRDLSRDLEGYFRTSEQIDTALQIEVLCDEEEPLGWAGGMLVQLLPGGDVAALESARARLSSEAIARAVRAGARSPEALVSVLLGPDILSTREDRSVQYWCPCTRERVLRALQTFGAAELFDMIHKDGKATADCDFCGQHYEITREELQVVLDQVDDADAEEEASLRPVPKATLH
jgi:molecular chaperone Hsp33